MRCWLSIGVPGAYFDTLARLGTWAGLRFAHAAVCSRCAVINSRMHCQLLVPDLFWPDRDGRDIYRELETPALQQLLAKGRSQHEPVGQVEAWLCDRFNVDRQADWPV